MPLDWHEVMKRAQAHATKSSAELKADGIKFDELAVRAVSIHAATTKYLIDCCNALERRIDELEKTPFSYDGPHETGKAYPKGTFVTHGGSLWHCNYKTASKPGDGPAWTLAVRKGRDARE